MNKYSIGDLLVFRDSISERVSCGLITEITKDPIWHGGGFYKISWTGEESQVLNHDSGTLSFGLVHNWVNKKEAQVLASQ